MHSGKEAGVDEDCLGQLSTRWKSCVRECRKRSKFASRAGGDGDFVLNMWSSVYLCDTHMDVCLVESWVKESEV